jgi:ABC-2 type transport system ATP-binding protein
VGLQFQTSGTAQIFGHPAGCSRANTLIGFLPERPYFYSHLTGKELLTFYGHLFQMSGAPLEKKVDALLARVQLTEFKNVPLKAYSKGMLQRVGLAQVLLNEPKLILLDEPMSGLDPMGRMLVRDIILEEKAKGTTLFFSSHILADVEQICDRVGLLIKGELRASGPIQELLAAGVETVDCVVSGIPPADLPGEHLGTDGDRVRLRIAADHVDSFLDQLRGQGGHLLELTPRRQGLEELLLEQLGLTRSTIDPKNMGVLG